MKRVLGILFAAMLMASAAIAAGPKDYQVTGPVLDVNDDMIIVEKGKEKWEIGRNKDTTVKKGSKVTVHYKMTATSVESKDAPQTKAKGETKTDTKAKTEAKTTK